MIKNKFGIIMSLDIFLYKNLESKTWNRHLWSCMELSVFNKHYCIKLENKIKNRRMYQIYSLFLF